MMKEIKNNDMLNNKQKNYETKMDISLLRIFKAVAEQGSISKASLVLNCVQSNVTARIQQLEEELGTDLFYRKPRGVVLTSAGKTLLGYAEKAMRLVEDAEKAVKENGELRGPLSLGSLESAAAVRLPKVLARYHQKYPEVEISLVTLSSQELLEKVLAYQIDGAFVSGKVNHPEVEQELMFYEELVLVTPQEIRSIKKMGKRTILVLRSGCNYKSQIEDWLGKRGVIPRETLEMGTREGIFGCISAGMGIAIFPRSIVNKLRFEDCVRIHPIPTQIGRVPTMFIRRRDTIRTKAMDALLRMVKEE